LIIEIEHDGFIGHGEATAITYYGMDIDDFIFKIESITPDFEKLHWGKPESLWPKITTLLPENTFLQSAIDCAIWDIYGKKQGIQLHDKWMEDEDELPLGSFTLSGDPKGIAHKLKTMDWPLYKIKMGTEHDDEIIECIKKHKGSSQIIIDANGGWNIESAIKYSKTLSNLGIGFIEQPLPPGQEERMNELKTENILWYADESAQGKNPIERCAKYFDGINFKLMKSGGLTPVLNAIQKAKEHNLNISLGCMTESSFGISALAQLAPLVESIDMDGNLLIKNDPGKGVKLVQGKIQFGDENGIGCKWRNSET
jgi:L-alanine-DL-glutamate epimerase-like enolase superfamily enzyme